MAITDIHSIKATPELATTYITSDKLEPMSCKDDTADALGYTECDKKTGIVFYKTISSSINCSLENANSEMKKVREQFGKDDKNLAYHLVQSFDEKVDPATAHEIGRRFAEEFLGAYQCVISTHTNTDHTHNHFVFNCVPFLGGNKYYDNNGTKREIRKISDRLCREYGLNVLESTAEMKLVKYKDVNGKTKFFEPTERKSALQKGEFSDANDYRNTKSFEEKETFKKSNLQVVREDIEQLIPFATDYENLLTMLREVGYEIKDKTAGGEWRKHISFKAPTQEKSTRDYSIDGESYTREALSARILQQQKDATKNAPILGSPHREEVPASENYEFGEIDIDSLDESYHTRKTADGERYERVQRSKIQCVVIIDMKQLNRQYNAEIKKAAAAPGFKKVAPPQGKAGKQSDYLLQQIKDNLKTLRFLENNSIGSFAQLNSMAKSLYERRDAAVGQLREVSELLQKANENIALIDKYNSLKAQTETDTNEYAEFERGGDVALLKSYEKLLKERGLSGAVVREHYAEKLDGFNAKLGAMTAQLEGISGRLSEFDRIIYGLNVIDKKNNCGFAEDVKEYYALRNNHVWRDNNESKNKFER